MIFNIGGRINPATQMPAFTFDGEYDLINDGFSNGVQNWRIRLYDSGSIRFSRVVSDIEVFLVGGGGGGAAAGGGGGGGCTEMGSAAIAQDTPYDISIGQGGTWTERCSCQGLRSSSS